MKEIWEHLSNLVDAEAIISKGGIYLVFFIVFAETGLFFGFFLPGDYLLFLAGIFCATGLLEVSIYHLLATLFLAGVLGNYVGYWFGRSTGRRLFNREDSFFFKKRYVYMAEDFFKKYGGMALVFGRFFPIIRTFAPIFAGVAKVSFQKFTLFNLLGSFFWVMLLTLLGFFLGIKFPGIVHYMPYIIVGLIAFTATPIVIAYFKSAKNNFGQNDLPN
ncbi:VTT domain-containing protein [uncultured Mucilaginibacter sp.]|uniref:DedA family protein n=1 Tax=uncultured Mucilaginibacter sp. TaxID=797541 RepID=UPI002624E3F2|nr:VTT domain-containing protein [uncultured Mucilaginibacter sp.]